MRFTIVAGALLAAGLSVPLVGQQTPGGTASAGSSGAARFPRNAAEFEDLYRQVSNWGRWGRDDQLGSANLVTPAKRKQAVGLVKDGISISLAHNPLTEKAIDNPNPFEHTMAPPGFFLDPRQAPADRWGDTWPGRS